MSKKERETNRQARAAAVQKQQADRERRRKVLIVGIVLAVLAAVVAGGVLLGGRDRAKSSVGGPLQATASGESLTVGNDPDAKVKVVVYEDFLCPACREFEATSRAYIHADAAKGRVLVEYRPFQLLDDPYSTRALMAWAAVLRKGTPKQALAFHDLLYENQPYESDVNKPGLAQLVALAKQAGVTDQAVLDAMGKDTDFVAAAGAAATKAQITGTPTVRVNGKQLTAPSLAGLAAELKRLIDKG